jgi:hypothetical protein
MLYIYTVMAENEYLLRYISGQQLTGAARSLPDPEGDTERFRDVVIDVPGRFKGRVRFERFHFKRGNIDRWFWTPYSAERLDNQSGPGATDTEIKIGQTYPYRRAAVRVCNDCTHRGGRVRKAKL